MGLLLVVAEERCVLFDEMIAGCCRMKSTVMALVASRLLR